MFQGLESSLASVSQGQAEESTHRPGGQLCSCGAEDSQCSEMCIHTVHLSVCRVVPAPQPNIGVVLDGSREFAPVLWNQARASQEQSNLSPSPGGWTVPPHKQRLPW